VIPAALAKRDKPSIRRSPTCGANLKSAGQVRPGNHEESFGCLWSVQKLLKQKLVCALPNARFGAIKHPAHLVCGIVWIETTALVETRIVNYPGTLPYCSCDSDTRGVVINALGKTVLILLILTESVTPQTAETYHRDQH